MEDQMDDTSVDLTRGTVDSLSILPVKSAAMYNSRYNNFIRWAEEQNVTEFTEEVFLDYFHDKAGSQRSSSLWSMYSMLKATFLSKRNMDISQYKRLLAFIKQKNVGYIPRKSDTFTQEDMTKFLTEAPDSKYLMWKVCLIFGVTGACSMDEIKKLTVDDIEDKGNLLIINIKDSKTGKRRVFIVTDKMYGDVNAVECYRKYSNLRPVHTPHRSFFVFYNGSKCSVQPVGIHTLGKIPKMIATYLKLPNPDNFTGHAFRRTSIALLADTGSYILNVKPHRTSKILNKALVTKIVNKMKEYAPSTSSNGFSVEEVIVKSEENEDDGVKSESSWCSEQIVKQEIEENDEMEEDEPEYVPLRCNRPNSDDFSLFGEHVASQLRLLPLENALTLQVQIQELISKQRILCAFLQKNNC